MSAQSLSRVVCTTAITCLVYLAVSHTHTYVATMNVEFVGISEERKNFKLQEMQLYQGMCALLCPCTKTRKYCLLLCSNGIVIYIYLFLFLYIYIFIHSLQDTDYVDSVLYSMCTSRFCEARSCVPFDPGCLLTELHNLPLAWYLICSYFRDDKCYEMPLYISSHKSHI